MALLSKCGKTDGSHNHLLFALSPYQIRSTLTPMSLSLSMKQQMRGRMLQSSRFSYLLKLRPY
ncbi:hypothetical protein CFP56_007772 [Quercus suber]|uniref:Uncharacterized protein n=1 Tax=Quercus suber TaxID=58331 RepID=A0AAW0M857_QUESU